VDKRTFIGEHRNKARVESWQGETARPASWQKSSHQEKLLLASVLVTANVLFTITNK